MEKPDGVVTQTQAHADVDLTEMINGQEIMSPSPIRIHQRVRGNIFTDMNNYVRKMALGKVYAAPFDVILEPGLNRVQPDILFIRTNRLDIIGDYVNGAPDLVIEIISPLSIELDTKQKKKMYERYGVSEYWIVAPDFNLIEIFVLENAQYTLNSYAVESGTVRSTVLQGFAVDVQNVF